MKEIPETFLADGYGERGSPSLKRARSGDLAGLGMIQATWDQADGLAGIARIKTSLALTRARSRAAMAWASSIVPDCAGCARSEDLKTIDWWAKALQLIPQRKWLVTDL